MRVSKASRPAPALAGYEPRGVDLGQINSVATSKNPARQLRLELFAVRCRQMVERVNADAVPFIWAVDCLYEAAVWSGLADDVGDDTVQAVMRDAFVGVRRP